MSLAAKNMMRILLDTFILVNPPLPHAEPWDALVDSDDAPVWGTAVASGAGYVVSNDTHHYPPADQEGRHRYQGIEYLRAKDFIRLLLDEKPTVHDAAVEGSE